MESDGIANYHADSYGAGGLRRYEACVFLVHMLEAASEPTTLKSTSISTHTFPGP